MSNNEAYVASFQPRKWWINTRGEVGLKGQATLIVGDCPKEGILDWRKIKRHPWHNIVPIYNEKGYAKLPARNFEELWGGFYNARSHGDKIELYEGGVLVAVFQEFQEYRR